MVRKDEGEQKPIGFLNKPLKNEFNDRDPFSRDGWARRLILFSLAIIVAIAIGGSCKPDPVVTCQIICGANQRTFDGYEYGSVILHCYCFSELHNNSLRYP